MTTVFFPNELGERERGLAEPLGVFDPAISDVAVSDNIQKIVGKIYTQVFVGTADLPFSGISEKIRTRTIVVSVTDWEAFCRLFFSIFKGAQPGLSGNRALRAILGSKDNEDVMALHNTAQARKDIHLALTCDRQYWHAWVDEPKIPECIKPIYNASGVRCTIL